MGCFASPPLRRRTNPQLSNLSPSIPGFPKTENSRVPYNYTFEVRSIDEFGRPGPATAFAFNILPPWYCTPYAYIGYVALVFCVFLLVARWWTQHLRDRNLELEAMVSQRTTELEQLSAQLAAPLNAKTCLALCHKLGAQIS